MKSETAVFFCALLAAPLLAGPPQRDHPAPPADAVGQPQPTYILDRERVLIQTLSEMERTQPDTPQAATLLNNLGTIYQEMGRYESAERSYKRSIQTWKAIPHVDPFHIARPICNLSSLYLENFMFAQAERLELRRIGGVLAEQHPHDDLTARIHNNIAFLELRKDRARQAEQAWLTALSIWEDAGPETLSVVQTLNNLTYFYKQQGRQADAEVMARRGLDAAARLIAAGGENQLWLLAMSAAIQVEIRDLRGAKVSSQRALSLAEKALGPHHPDTARFLLLHADILEKTHDGDAAKRFRARGMAILEGTYFGEMKRHTVDFTELGESFR